MEYILWKRSPDHESKYHHPIFGPKLAPAKQQFWGTKLDNVIKFQGPPSKVDCTLPIGSMVLPYMVTWISSIYPQCLYIYIPAPWILWDYCRNRTPAHFRLDFHAKPSQQACWLCATSSKVALGSWQAVRMPNWVVQWIEAPFSIIRWNETDIAIVVYFWDGPYPTNRYKKLMLSRGTWHLASYFLKQPGRFVVWATGHDVVIHTFHLPWRKSWCFDCDGTVGCFHGQKAQLGNGALLGKLT